MNPITGTVLTVSLAVGQADLIQVQIPKNPPVFGNPNETEWHWVNADRETSHGDSYVLQITVDGRIVPNIGDLFEWLSDKPVGSVTVTLHPDPMRYGVSMHTEFASKTDSALASTAQSVATL
jgi:hypothetical protein